MEKKEKTIIGHIGVVGPRLISRRRKQRVLSSEEKEKLVSQSKAPHTAIGQGAFSFFHSFILYIKLTV